MNLNKYDFSENTRQSKVAIILLVIKFYKTIVRQALPFIAIFIIGSAKKSITSIYITILAISILVFIMAILSYLKFYFRLENGELIIEKGVFKKVKLNIPFERIQTVNFEQGIILQAFNKFKVEVDTAGSAKKEFSFDALDKKIAEELREYILDRKMQLGDVEELEAVDKEQQEGKNIFHLTIPDLLKVGITENHLKAGAWLFAVAGYLFSLSSDFGFKLEDEIEKNIKGISIDVLYFAAAGIGILVLFVLISMIRTILKYYNLRFDRMRNGFKVYSGLLNRKEYSAPDSKIQKVSWGDNPLRRLFGIFMVYFKQAKSVESDRNKSISVPILEERSISKVLEYLYGGEINEKMHSFSLSGHFFMRMFLYFILVPSVCGIVAGVYFGITWLLVFSIIYLLYFTIARWVQWKKAAYSFNDKFIKRKKGIYGNHNEITPWYKVQSIELNQSLYQRRYDLATLVIHTAAGYTILPFIKLGQAQKLRDYGLFVAESSSREWM